MAPPRIYLLPVGPADLARLGAVGAEVAGALGSAVALAAGVGEPAYAYDPLRQQYWSTRILKEILPLLPADGAKLVGATEVDLFIPILTFVFGEAQLGGTAALVSSFRLRQEYYGLAPNEALLRRRLKKEVLHELGHTFGLTHCAHEACVMYLANAIVDVDRKGDFFCPACHQAAAAALAR